MFLISLAKNKQTRRAWNETVAHNICQQTLWGWIYPSGYTVEHSHMTVDVFPFLGCIRNCSKFLSHKFTCYCSPSWKGCMLPLIMKCTRLFLEETLLAMRLCPVLKQVEWSYEKRSCKNMSKGICVKGEQELQMIRFIYAPMNPCI